MQHQIQFKLRPVGQGEVIHNLTSTTQKRVGPNVFGNIEDDEGMEDESIPEVFPISNEMTENDILDLITIPNEGLTAEQRNALVNLCKEFKDIFSLVVRDIPADVTPMKLQVKKDLWEVPRNSMPPRVQSTQRLAEIRRQVKLMIALNVISPSLARHYSQVLLVPKPDNAWRFCIDYRSLNLATLVAKWPLPRIDELLRFIGATLAIFFSKIDCTSGYHQMSVDILSRILTAFITQDGIYEWQRVAMGLSGSGSHFQKVMTDEVLGPELVRQGVLVYLDDLLTYGKTLRST
jgi:hypothetical protein